MSYLVTFLVLGAVFVPSAIAVALVWAQRRRLANDGRRSPIENRPIYGAGEQLRKRVEDHGDEILLSLTMLFFIGPMLIALWATKYVPWTQVRLNFWDYVLVAMYVGVAVAAIWRIHKHADLRRIANAGLQAELYTAQELNRLMALGCTVLHDVPGERFNIDHVVIGPRAVYAVETKSVSKPKDDYKVIYDGEKLHFPGFSDSKRLEQARRQADWLAKHLRQVLNRPIPVVPALALPGWWIESKSANADVQVFTPTGRGAHFMVDDRSGVRIDAATAGLVTQALVMRYPTGDSDKK
jgi:hypothetical protein